MGSLKEISEIERGNDKAPSPKMMRVHGIEFPNGNRPHEALLSVSFNPKANPEKILAALEKSRANSIRVMRP